MTSYAQAGGAGDAKNVSFEDFPMYASSVDADMISLIRGRCRNLVTGVRIGILYQSAGKQKAHQTFQIVGAAVAYVEVYLVGPRSGRTLFLGGGNLNFLQTLWAYHFYIA